MLLGLVGARPLPNLIARATVGPWARGPYISSSLVGETPLPDLVARATVGPWARGPVGPRSLGHKFSLEEAVLTIFSIFVRTASSRADYKISSKLVVN